MRKRISLFVCFGLVFMLLVGLCIPVTGLADAGDFGGDFDFGDFDFGGSDGDSDFDFLPFFFIGDGGCSGGNLVWIVCLIITMVVFSLIKNKNRKNGNSTGPNHPQGAAPTIQDRSQRDENLRILKEKDPGFSEEAFLSRISNMYVQMQNAWEAKKWAPIRIMMTDALFEQFNRQLKAHIDAHNTNHIERIAVLSTEISSVSQDSINDIIKVILKTRIVDYTTNDFDGKLLSGSRTAEKFMTYEWTLIRAVDVKTEEVKADGAVTHSNCPNCGAPISINQSGQCEYCGSILTSGKYDWVISAIRAISQVTRG